MENSGHLESEAKTENSATETWIIGIVRTSQSVIAKSRSESQQDNSPSNGNPDSRLPKLELTGETDKAQARSLAALEKITPAESKAVSAEEAPAKKSELDFDLDYAARKIQRLQEAILSGNRINTANALYSLTHEAEINESAAALLSAKRVRPEDLNYLAYQMKLASTAEQQDQAFEQSKSALAALKDALAEKKSEASRYRHVDSASSSQEWHEASKTVPGSALKLYETNEFLARIREKVENGGSVSTEDIRELQSRTERGGLINLQNQALKDAATAQWRQEILIEADSIFRHCFEAFSFLISYGMERKESTALEFDEAIKKVEIANKRLHELCRSDSDSMKRLTHSDAILKDGIAMLKRVKKERSRGQKNPLTFMNAMKKQAFLFKEIKEFKKLKQDMNNPQIEKEAKARKAHARDRALLFLALFSGLGLNVIAAFWVANLFSRSISSRLLLIADNTKLLAQQKSLHEPLSGSDELALLDRTFHEMSEALAASKENKGR